MTRKQPVRAPPSERIKLDPLQDVAAVGKLFCLVRIEVIRFQKLELQWNGKPVLHPAVAEPD